jgi:hypothetical protein
MNPIATKQSWIIKVETFLSVRVVMRTIIIIMIHHVA